MELVKKHCVPCEGGIPKLSTEQSQKMMTSINRDWQLIEDKKIRREYKMVSFKQVMEFVNSVALLADSEGHHPEISLGYGHCEIEIWTHSISGLSENDFILAAKIDELY